MRHPENVLTPKKEAVKQAVNAVLYFTGVEENLPESIKFLEDWFLSGIQEMHYDCEDSRTNAVSVYRILKTLLIDISEIDRQHLMLAKK